MNLKLQISEETFESFKVISQNEKNKLEELQNRKKINELTTLLEPQKQTASIKRTTKPS